MSQIRCQMRSPSRGAACSSLGELLVILCVEMSPSRSGRTPKWAIFNTDSRSYLTRFARTVTVQARKVRPSSAGDFRDLRSYLYLPRFPSSLGAIFLGRPGCFDHVGYF